MKLVWKKQQICNLYVNFSLKWAEQTVPLCRKSMFCIMTNCYSKYEVMLHITDILS
jgi:hypothetical protein